MWGDKKKKRGRKGRKAIPTPSEGHHESEERYGDERTSKRKSHREMRRKADKRSTESEEHWSNSGQRDIQRARPDVDSRAETSGSGRADVDESAHTPGGSVLGPVQRPAAGQGCCAQVAGTVPGQFIELY